MRAGFWHVSRMKRLPEEHSATVEGQLVYTRAYLSAEVPCRYIKLLGGDLAETATYSWGSAVLAILFRELCQATSASATNIGGCLLLLQIWAWSRFPAISPPIPPPSDADDHYRHKFNNVNVRLLRRDLKTYRIELDQMGRDDPDRCMRQFGMQQHIPRPAAQLKGAHDLTLRGKMTDDWEVKMDPFIQLWNTRHELIEPIYPSEGSISPNSEYMTWFFTHTRRHMTRQVARIRDVVAGVEWIWWMNSPQFDAQFSKRQVQAVCDQLLGALREFGQVAEPGPSATTGLLVGLPDPALEVPLDAKEGRGLGQRRLRHEMESYEIPRPGPRGGCVYRPPMWANMAYTEVPWYPEEIPAEVPPEMPQQVPPEIHVPMPCYTQPETMFASQTQVPYSYEWPSQSSQAGFATSTTYQLERASIPTSLHMAFLASVLISLHTVLLPPIPPIMDRVVLRQDLVVVHTS
ncbi:hypothetical protein K1719_018287 [Acacia pycnantha]|nr:hypothetical protein K1719_018287 [Acacia pycnantha]